jgi:hypothetical protein
MRTRIMYVENKSAGLVGPGRAATAPTACTAGSRNPSTWMRI